MSASSLHRESTDSLIKNSCIKSCAQCCYSYIVGSGGAVGYVVAASYDGGVSLVRVGSLGSAGGGWWATGRRKGGREGIEVLLYIRQR